MSIFLILRFLLLSYLRLCVSKYNQVKLGEQKQHDNIFIFFFHFRNVRTLGFPTKEFTVHSLERYLRHQRCRNQLFHYYRHLNGISLPWLFLAVELG